MTLTITIKCDNAAFDNAGDEVSRILRNFANTIGVRGIWEREHLDELEGMLFDYNGNNVGSVEVSE